MNIKIKFWILTCLIVPPLVVAQTAKKEDHILPFTGKYVIERALDLPGVKGMRQDEIDSIIGRNIEFTDEYLDYQSKLHSIQSMEIMYQTDEEFQRLTTGSASPPLSFKILGYSGKQKYLHSYEIRFKDDYWGIGTFVDYFDSTVILVDRDGVWFRLKIVE